VGQPVTQVGRDARARHGNTADRSKSSLGEGKPAREVSGGGDVRAKPVPLATAAGRKGGRGPQQGQSGGGPGDPAGGALHGSLPINQPGFGDSEAYLCDNFA